MKNLMLSIFLLCFLPPSVLEAQNEKSVKTTVQRATIFQQGALLSSTEWVSVNAGTTNIIFENVSPYLQQNSLQAAGKNDLVIMDVQYRLKYTEQTKTDSKPDDPRVIRWKEDLINVKDSLDDLSFVKKDIQNRINTLQTERHVLLNNRMMKGDLQRDSLALFMQSIDFLRKRQNDIDAELLKLEKEAFKENRLRSQLNSRIATLNSLIQGIGTPINSNPTKPMPQVIVTVMSDRAMAAEITLTYFVQQAGWTAFYDLKASKENQNIDLKHRAAVYQNTGIDWKDVLLTLSTGDPNQGNTKPTLTPQYLVYNVPIFMQTEAYRSNDNKINNLSKQPVTQNQANMAFTSGAIAKDNVNGLDEDIAFKEKEGVMDYTQINQNMMRIEYEIKLKYNIESDNKAHSVVIQSKTIPAIYAYSVVPKLDPDAFLMARVTDWEDMNLIPGTARIYFDNSYIGESFINPRNTNDTLQLNLGRDKSIVVSRTKVKDKCKEKMMSDNHLLTQVYEITVRNTKTIPIRLIIEDQMPVTKEQDIKIEYLENSGARFNMETGKLVWDFNLKPKDSKKLTFSYEVKSPKDKSLSSL
jgi:uncharacterized protein (TIGR02231 family)